MAKTTSKRAELHHSPFLCQPLKVILAVVGCSATCLCPSGLFFEGPRTFLLMLGVGLIIGGFLWLAKRHKVYTGEDMRDDTPWFLRGGLATAIQMGGLVKERPNVFGPPALVVGLGTVLCIAPAFAPNVRGWFTPKTPPQVQQQPAAQAGPQPGPPPGPQPGQPGQPAQQPPVPQQQPAQPQPGPAKPKPSWAETEPGDWRYLADMPEFDAAVAKPWTFAKDGTTGNPEIRSPIKVGGHLSPKGLGMHPPEAAYSSVKYRLDRKAAQFKSVGAVSDSSSIMFSPLDFEVWGDGRRLWQSQRITDGKQLRECAVDVSTVSVLELRAVAVGHHTGLHAVWLEPRVLMK